MRIELQVNREFMVHCLITVIFELITTHWRPQSLEVKGAKRRRGKELAMEALYLSKQKLEGWQVRL